MTERECTCTHCTCEVVVTVMGCGHTDELYAAGSFTFQAKDGKLYEVYCCRSCFSLLEGLELLGIIEITL